MTSYPATYFGLHKWTMKSFEKLGWMVLAQKYNNNEKVNEYVSSINNLKESLLKKINDTQENDRKMDLQILLDQVNTLVDFVNTAIQANNQVKMEFGRRKYRR